MKQIVVLLSILLSFGGFAQTASNNWIDYAQEYYAFPISEDGMYRISFSDLQSANFPISSVDPRNIQIFSKGREIPLHIQGESDGTFDATDYIEFYAEKNKGDYDSVVYKGLDKQPNPYYSLFSDSIRYFLTFNASINNLRYSQETAVDFGNYFPATYLWKENVISFQSFYYDGQTTASNATDPDYVPTEGWMDNALNLGQSRNYSLSFNNRFVGGPFVEMEIAYTGQSNYPFVSDGDHHIQLGIGAQQIDDVFEGYKLRKQRISFSPSEVTGGPNLLNYRSINDRSSAVDRTALAYVSYRYPHSLVLDNVNYFEFLIEDQSSQNKQFTEFINFDGGSEALLYDLTNRKRIRTVKTLSSYRALIPNGGSVKKCVLLNELAIRSVNLQAVSPTAKFTNYAAQAPDSSFLILYHPKVFPEATRYSAYRSSTGHRPLLVNVEELYDQFSFGIRQHPLAIRNFISYAFSDFNQAPKYLLLAGKSVNQQEARKDPAVQVLNLVPSYGNPSTDNLLTAGLGTTQWEALIPTGRISANNNTDLGIYLDKLIEYENAPDAMWMKEAIHFAGGLSQNESNQFVGYLNNYNRQLGQKPFGGRALLFQKSSSVPIQTTLSDSIRNLINQGTSLMTFFGHAAATGGFDISIDSPDKLNNRGKYPVILANSCFSGNYHQPAIQSVAEEYVLERNKGSIAFIASGSLGFASTLNIYSSAFYENLTSVAYGKGLGELMVKTVADIQSNNPFSNLRLVSLEMSLQGDPALRMNPFELPDYEIQNSGFRTNPAVLSTEIDSFQLELNIRNIGRAVSDTLLVQVSRRFPLGGQDTSYLRFLPGVDYSQELLLTLPIDRINGIGLNEFNVILDPNGDIQELNLANNRIDFNLFVRAGEIIPVYPYEFSIVPNQGPVLRASTAFALEDDFQYSFELDTNGSFSSPWKKMTSVFSGGGVVEWAPTALLNMRDSAVYFWRVSRVPKPGESPNWRTSSFQYISNQSGWSQAHHDQFKSNSLLFLEENSNLPRFDFADNVKELFVKNIGSPLESQNNEIRYSVDADTRERNACGGTPGFLIAVLDSLDLASWETPYGGSNSNRYYNQANSDDYCAPNRQRSEKYFLFRANVPAQMTAMKNFLNQEIPAGNFVVAYSWQKLKYSDIWNLDSTILQAFANLGSSLIYQLNDLEPFIFTAQKGDLGSVQEIKGNSSTAEIELRRTLKISANFGEMASPPIAYSKNWKRLAYRARAFETPSQDSLELNLYGVKASGDRIPLFSSGRFYQDSSISSSANGQDFRGLNMELKLEDEGNQTPPQLLWWQVLSDEIPDAALAPNIYFKTNADTLQEGEALSFEIAVKNVSNSDLDSLLVQYSILTNQNQMISLPDIRMGEIAADSVLIAEVEVPTVNLRGKNSLLMELNPNQDQEEKHRFNNFGQFDFTVQGDRLNPLVDVTFDGRYILNRELVSAKPEIVIQLKDENNYLALDDTSVFSIFLRHPNGQEELLNFGSNTGGQMEFIPARLPDNKAIARLRPEFAVDGIYRLRIQAFDKSGNASGSQDYQVEFEVINQSSITRMVNYPNPFSTSTRFVFTLTGSQIPDQIQIQILTVTGKVVREIDQFELGPIHIGQNLSQYAWDGKDEFGDQLANGVYLYRVRVRMNGSSIDRRKSNADQFFVKDFGKMYLLR